MQPKLIYWLVLDVKIQNFLLARFARQKIINNFKLYLLLARHVRIYFQTASSLVWSLSDILYTLYPYFTIRMTNYHDLIALNNMWVMFTQAYQINLSVKLAREPKLSVKLTMKLSGCSSCSVKLSRKPELSMLSVNLLQKPCESLN